MVYADIPSAPPAWPPWNPCRAASPSRSSPGSPSPRVARPTFPCAVKTLVSAKPDIISIVIPAQLAGEFLKAYRSGSGGLPAQLATVSYGNAETLCQVAGEEAARGGFVAQVMPNLGNSAIPVVRRFREDMSKFAEPGTRPSIFHLEAYVTARPKLVQALDGLKNYDVGGYAVDLSPTRHTGRTLWISALSGEVQVDLMISANTLSGSVWPLK